MKWILALLTVILLVLHQDLWNWNKPPQPPPAPAAHAKVQAPSLHIENAGGPAVSVIPAPAPRDPMAAGPNAAVPRADMVGGFLPIGLWYHALFCVAASILLALFVLFAWPKHLENSQPETPEARIAEGSAGH